MSSSIGKKALPNGWSAVPLGNLISLEYGKSFPEKKRRPGPYAVYGSNGLVGRAHMYILEEKTVIVGRKGSAGEVNYAQPKSWPIDTTYYVEVKNPKVSGIDFIYYLLKWLDPRRLIDTTTKPGLNRDRVYEQVVPLPPLPVQERIVEILQKADEIRLKRKEALELADKILPALFLEMFGDPATNPKGWPKLPLGKCTAIRRGLSKRPSPTGNVPIVRIKNLTLWGLDLSWSERVEASPQEIERGRLLPGDIVFSPLNGSISHLAKSEVFTVPETEIWVLDSNLCAFRVNESVVRNGFLAAFLALPSTLELFRRRLAVKTSGGQWLLKTSTLQGVEVPVPPLQLQDYFIQQVEQHLDVRRKCTDALKESELCFGSLLSQSFTG
jgi:type I restriction enzyme S subunit